MQASVHQKRVAERLADGAVVDPADLLRFVTTSRSFRAQLCTVGAWKTGDVLKLLAQRLEQLNLIMETCLIMDNVEVSLPAFASVLDRFGAGEWGYTFDPNADQRPDGMSLLGEASVPVFGAKGDQRITPIEHEVEHVVSNGPATCRVQG